MAILNKFERKKKDLGHLGIDIRDVVEYEVPKSKDVLTIYAKFIMK